MLMFRIDWRVNFKKDKLSVSKIDLGLLCKLIDCVWWNLIVRFESNPSSSESGSGSDEEGKSKQKEKEKKKKSPEKKRKAATEPSTSKSPKKKAKVAVCFNSNGNYQSINQLACVASVSVRFRGKERGTRVKDRAKSGARESLFHFLALVSFLARSKPKVPFLGISFQTETLATQAINQSNFISFITVISLPQSTV